MKKKDIKIGMKVVPHQKSYGRSFEECYFWKTAKNTKNQFLYVVAYDKEEDIYCLSFRNDNKAGVSAYKAEDFNPLGYKSTPQTIFETIGGLLIIALIPLLFSWIWFIDAWKYILIDFFLILLIFVIDAFKEWR